MSRQRQTGHRREPEPSIPRLRVMDAGDGWTMFHDGDSPTAYFQTDTTRDLEVWR